MKKRKGKTKRWLAGILSAVLVIGSINLVDALEGSNGESALYDAPELTITQGATDYDLMKDITYDHSLYELAVTDEGGFDVNTVGDYEVTYSLTSKDDGTLDPGDSGDASNSDNENKDQNSGTDTSGADSSQGGDNSDAAGSGSNADNAGSSDSSDSSNGGDSADAGQGDTGSDSGNAGDNADAGQGDTGSDSSNAEDTADAVSGEDAAQSEENTGDTGVLGVSRPRTAVNMSYQSEPVNAEAVDVTEGDATNSGDTQEKQVITFTRMVHVVAASEDKEPVYVARELVLTQGEEDYDLTDDILYDDVKYTLEVVELGGFDINKIGSYEVTYSLTPVTTEGTQENGQHDTQENQVITFQRTVTVKAAVEETGEFEVPELYLEQGQEDYDLAAGLVYDENKYKLNIKDDGNFDIMLSGEYKVTFVLNPLEENPDYENNTGDADTSDPDQTDGDQSEKVLGATWSMDSSAENADDKTENKNTEDNNTEDNNTEDNNTENDNVEDKKEENDNTANTDQAEDTFVIPDGITTFTRRVVVTPGIALLSAGNTINNNYPWSPNMTDSSVTLSAPKDDTYAGTPVLQWTNTNTLGKADITDNSWENVPGVTVVNKNVTLSGASLVDGKWYRFKFSDDDYSEAVRLVSSNGGGYRGGQKWPLSKQFWNFKWSSWYISNDNVMYTPSKTGFVSKCGFDICFYYNGYWNATSFKGEWSTITTSTAANEISIYDAQTHFKSSPIRFYFEDYTIFLNIKPADKAYSIATDICLGNKSSIGTYYDSLNMRATDNRKIHQFDFVGKQPDDPYQPNQMAMVVKSYTELCKWAAEKHNDAVFFKNNPVVESSQDAGISLSWENQNDILVSISLTTLENSSIVIQNVKFESGNGTFTEPGKKQEYLFFDNEVLGTQQVYPPVINNKVIEKIPAVRPNNNVEKFQGWKLAVSGTPDGDIDLNKLYTDDEVAALKYKDVYKTMTFTAQYGEEQAQIFTGGTTAAKKYASVEQALKDAASGDTVRIIKDGKITPTTADGVEAAKDVTLEHYNDATRFYKTTVSSKIAVDEDSVVTLMDGKLELSANASVKVLNPTDGQTYQVTAPDCTSWVTVDDKDKGDSPYFMGDADGSVKIDAVTYSYRNPDQDNRAMVYIPQGMKNNDKVTKAEVAADQQVTIEVDNTNSVVLKGTGSQGNTVTVERRTTDSKVDVKLPSGAQGTIFGHAVGAAPAGGVTVSQSSAENTGYPDRKYIVIAVAGEKVTVDGIEYVATENKQKFYLGTFKAIVTIGSNAEITSGKEQTDVGYLKTYTVKISPKADYDLDQDNFIVTMKESDTGTVKNLTFADVCRVDPADGSITVTIPNVSGDITVNAAAKRQMTTLKVTGLAAGKAKGSFKAVDASGNEYKLEQDGSINVNRNEELTLIFTPNDFSNPYYSDLTGEKGESFSILTALKETTNNKDLFAGAKTFNWKEKSYELKYTPTTSDVTLEAVFTPSHIVHVHVTGGTAEVKDTGLVTKESGADQFQHVIVKNNETVELELKDTTGTATTYKKAYWSNVDGSDDTDVSNQAFTGNGTSYTYTTQAVGKPQALNITFEEGQTVDVKVTHGKLVTGNDGVAWNDKGNSTYQTIVKNNGALKVNIKPEDGYGLKSITVNNVAIDIDAAIKSGEITWDGITKTYSHTFAKVYQAWNVTVDFEKLHEIVFEDQKGNILNKTEHITVIDGDTIPAAIFTKMQEEADKSKAENESLFVWVDKTDRTKIYNETTVMTAQTADVVNLISVYRMNVIKGADGSVIAADDFVIHVNDVRKLTDTEAVTLANVTAYDHSGSDISNMVTVEQTKLEELKKKTKGTYVDALTFMIEASGLTTGVEVEVTDDNPTITGKTAYTLTFKGRANETYKYQELDAQGIPTGNESTILTDGDGKATITGLKKATPYQISHKKYGSVNGKTALVDAKDIAKQFADDGDQTTTNGKTDKDEKASNNNVDVVVDADGNYKVIVKKDIDHTVEIPDTWGEVKIDLNDKTITGDKADDNNEAKPGLEFVKDVNSNEHPGTNLEIVNGTIKGGDGSAKHPDGAAGIGASGDTADAGLIIGNNANVIGGNGANGTEGKDGGNGGAGIDGNGKITPTVNGTVTGGNGGKGGDSATGTPGNGGNGGNGISAGDKTITINPSGTVKGGDAGSGGNATGDNTNPGGNGGNGGTGTETTQPGKTDNNGGTTSGGNGGDGGTSNNGNGGNGGNGGSGSTGENNNNGGTSSGGNGGNGGDSDKGNGGSGGNGGSSGETGGNGGNNTGGNGGNGGDSNSGNGGSGGNGGDSNSGTGGNGGNGGDSNNGTGGNGGNGGGSNNGPAGNGGNGGNSNNGNGGNGGNGGDSNSGNNGNGGSSGSNGNRPGGNGGGSNNGNGGNGGNNGGGNSGNNGGDNSGNNGGDNGGNNGGDNSNNNSGSTGNTGNTPDAGNTAGNDSGNNAHKGNKGNSTGNSNAGQKDPAEDDSLNDAADESSLTGDADGSDADGSDADGIQEEESIHADSDSVENGTDSDSHIPFGECGFHWIPIVWLLVILGYTVVRVKKLRDESEEA